MPFDVEYTRTLGYGAVRYLLEGGSGALITLKDDRVEPLALSDLLDPETGRIRIRRVDTRSDVYQTARRFMTRLERADLEAPKVDELAAIAGLAPRRKRSTRAFRARRRGDGPASHKPGQGTVTVPEASFAERTFALAPGSFPFERLELGAFTPVVQDWGGPIGLAVAGAEPDRIERLVIGNTWCWPVNGDFHFEAFSRVVGGPIGKLAILRGNAFVNVFVPAGIKRSRVSDDVLEAYRRALPKRASGACRATCFPAASCARGSFLARSERALDALKSKPALIVWGDADFAFRPKERARFEAAFADHRTVILPGAGHYTLGRRAGRNRRGDLRMVRQQQLAAGTPRRS